MKVFLLLSALALAFFPAAATSQEAAAQSDVNALRDAVLAEADAVLKPRIEALEINKKTFESGVANLKYFGWLMVAFAAVLTFFGLKTIGDIKNYAKNEAERTINELVASSKSENNALKSLIDQVTKARDELDKLTVRLSGYVALAQTAEVASRFDPLVEFHKLRVEVRKRHPLTIASRLGREVEVAETTDDPIFRQRAAVIFERLLEAIKSDQISKVNRMGTVDLFNAAAVASEAGMDFVSVQLMEAAASLDIEVPVEIEARLIRQQVSLSRITDQQATERLKLVIERTTGYDVHLVASEAYNIGQKIARPSETATLVMDNISPELRENSYVLLNGARMMSMGNSQSDWDTARDWAVKGVTAFLNEPKSVRWYESSQEEIIRLREERPDIKALFGKELDKRLGSEKRPEGPSPDQFLALLRAAAAEDRSRRGDGDNTETDTDKDPKSV